MHAGLLLLSLCLLSEKESGRAIASRLEQLVSDDFDDREVATRALMLLPQAEGLLEAAAKDGDADLKKRAETIVRELTRQRAQRGIKRGTLLVSAGNADLLPDIMRTFQPYDPRHQLHGSFVLMIADLSTREKAFAKRGEYKPREFVVSLGTKDSEAWLRTPIPFQFRHVRSGYFIRSSTNLEVLILSGDARAGGGFSDTIVFADDLNHSRGYHSLKHGIFICNGEVKSRYIDDSIIICDDLEPAAIDLSICIARRSLQYVKRRMNHKVDAGDPVYQRENKNTLHVVPPGKRSFGLIRFFEVADVGLTLDACKVTKVAGPLAKAGVKPGDVFTHVDGVAVKDAEALRKALRRRYAILGFGAFTLTREGKPLTVVAELGE